MITIGNNGPLLVETNYWESEWASRGVVYMTANAGAWRMLVPSASHEHLAEMRTGTSVTIEPSINVPGNMDVVFEDGTPSPFCVSMSLEQFDRPVAAGVCKFLVYSPDGLQL